MIDLVKLFESVQDAAASKERAKQSLVVHLSKERLAGDQMLVYHPAAASGEERFEFIDLPVPPRSYQAQTVGGLIEAVTDLHERKVTAGSGTDPIRVFVHAAGITALIGEGKRRERIEMELQTSTGWDLLTQDGLKNKSQADMVDLLRLEFGNRVMPASFVPSIRKLKFNSNASGHSDVAVGRESMGRAVMTEALADGQSIAETVSVHVRVFENVSTEIVGIESIACGVQVNLAASTLSLRMVAGETATAMEKALDALTGHLREKLPEAVKVFNGVEP